MFHSKSNENTSEDAKVFVLRLNQERRQRERSRIHRMQQEQLRLSRVCIKFDNFFRKSKSKRLLKISKKQRCANKVIDRLEFLNDKRSKEREKREEMQKEWEKRKKEIDNTVYLHQKLNASIGILNIILYLILSDNMND